MQGRVSVNRDSGLSAICGIEMGLHAVRLRGPYVPRDQFPCAHAQNLRRLGKLIPGPQAIPSTWSRNINYLPAPRPHPPRICRRVFDVIAQELPLSLTAAMRRYQTTVPWDSGGADDPRRPCLFPIPPPRPSPPSTSQLGQGKLPFRRGTERYRPSILQRAIVNSPSGRPRHSRIVKMVCDPRPAADSRAGRARPRRGPQSIDWRDSSGNSFVP
jgi:hypothetical protein